MKIYFSQENAGQLVCLCGFHPTKQGFYPCNAQGEDIGLVQETQMKNWYACAKCGHIIDFDALDVVGIRSDRKLTVEE